MSEQIINTTLLVRDVADDCLSHGERTFAYGLSVLTLTVGGVFAAAVLRQFGVC